MKKWLVSLAMCQSMFCAIPCPWHGWDEEQRDRMLQCLPFIGLEIGALWYLTALAAFALPLPGLLRAAVVCGAPWLMTGFMHLDGFMDVTDAVRSWRSPERRREILKDSHVGSFSVIGFGLVLLLQFAAAAGAESAYAMRPLILIPVVSRCFSVLAIHLLKPMSSSQYAARKQGSGPLILPIILLAAAAAAGLLLDMNCLVVLTGEAAVYLLFLRRAVRSLEGMNGDISGYCITLSELAALALSVILM